MEGYELAIEAVYGVADQPVLQDDSTNDVLGNWSAAQRDFVILGGSNEEVDRYNLTISDLEDQANREMVAAAWMDAAEAVG